MKPVDLKSSDHRLRARFRCFVTHCIPQVVETGESFNSDWAMEPISVVHHNHDSDIILSHRIIYQ